MTEADASFGKCRARFIGFFYRLYILSIIIGNASDSFEGANQHSTWFPGQALNAAIKTVISGFI